MALRWSLISPKWNLRHLISSGSASKVISFCFWLMGLFDWTIDPKKRITHIIDTLKIADYETFSLCSSYIDGKDRILGKGYGATGIIPSLECTALLRYPGDCFHSVVRDHFNPATCPCDMAMPGTGLICKFKT